MPDPLGKHLVANARQLYKIVGIVDDTRVEIDRPALPIFYFPLFSGAESGTVLAVRSTRAVTSLALPIQEIVQQLDSELPVSDILCLTKTLYTCKMNDLAQS